MLTAFRTTSSLSLLMALAFCATAALAAPSGGTAGNCAECWMSGGKSNLTGDHIGHEAESNGPVAAKSSDAASSSKVAKEAPDQNDDPNNKPANVTPQNGVPVEAPDVADANKADQVDDNQVAVAIDDDHGQKHKSKGADDEHNARGEHDGARHSGGNGNGGGHNADGSPK